MRLSKKQKILIVLIGLLIITLLNVFQKPVRNFFYSISCSSQKKLWRAGDRASDFFAGLLFAEKLEKEREKTHSYNQQLLARLAALNVLEQENKVLREALGLGLQEEFTLILTEIIGKDISQDFILLAKGSKDGILKDQPVITKEKVLCGKIQEVYKDFSKMELISYKKSSFDVKIYNKDISAVLKGEGGQRLLLELIPKGAGIERGDPVLTTSLAKIFPANLLVGKIKKIVKSDVEPFAQAEVAMDCHIKELEKLFIITNY